MCGADDMNIYVYNYNTLSKVTKFEAHMDYIRYIEIHPTLPCFLSTSDDLEIKLWDWSNDFECTRVFTGHIHYTMMVKFNPKDPNYFATASLDKFVKVWSLSSSDANFSLGPHDQGVNCVEYLIVAN